MAGDGDGDCAAGDCACADETKKNATHSCTHKVRTLARGGTGVKLLIGSLVEDVAPRYRPEDYVNVGMLLSIYTVKVDIIWKDDVFGTTFYSHTPASGGNLLLG